MRFSKAVVRGRVAILILTVLLMIPAVFGMLETRINYDMLNYLPDDMDTVIGQNALLEDFGKGAFSFIVVENMPEKDVAALQEKPKVLILDDSTSAVDTATDAKIRAAFAKSIPGTTKFIIAQRISSVQDADRIIVLDGGRVNGFDTHEKLVETNEIYREIYESQVKGGGDFDVQSAGKEEA